MNSLFVLIIAAAGIAVGYGLYAKSIDRRVIQPDNQKATPAKMYMDGVDFIPANRNVLFGYQFKSIAALGPILGPIIAVQWGWLPALLWIVLGTFFIGWVQDYSSIIMGVREEGQTFGALSYRLISPRSRMILLTFIYFYLWLIMGSFGVQVGFNLLTNTAVPLGVIIVILVGLLAGQMTYKWKQDIILTTVITVILALVGIWLGMAPGVRNFFASLYGTAGGKASPTLFLDVTLAKFIGSLLVVIICYFGSVLPIWRWAQPINYVAFWIVSLGVLGGLIGLLIWRPGMGDFPAYRMFDVPGLGPLWPILFVTIACGAISGWHSLVSSSGTARQLEREGDAIFVGGGAMFFEMFFAIMAFLTATVAFGSFDGYVKAGGGAAPAKVFSVGLSTFMNKWGLDKLVGEGFGVAYGGVFLTLMALTIMYLVVRFMRVASAEALGDKFPAIRNMHVGTIIALLLTLALIWLVPFLQIWVVFGAANQLMASLALLLITLWLMSKGKNYTWTFWPFVFMFVTTIGALLYKAYEAFFIKLPQTADPAKYKIANVGQFTAAQVIIGIVALILVIAAGILAYDGVTAIRRYRAELAKGKA
ncbi:MAG: carbon starvation CstA family protein [Anaerolineae bacterium]|nr:carbon starvation CstA family protein [Anaerolineae bacterium]